MSALMLKIVACAAMLIDHIGFQYGNMLCRAIGRIAFPIFVYLLCNGFHHTSNKGRYALRLAIFAILSQVPFSLFCYGVLWQSHGNVMFTLLMAFLCLWSAEELRCRRGLRWLAFVPSLAVCALYHFGLLSSDYGAKGILLALVFYCFDGNRILTALGMLFAVFYTFFLSLAKNLWFFVLKQDTLPLQMSQWEMYQFFSLLALIFIFSYNGRKGRGSGKLLQYFFYLFYPLHQLALWLIRYK